MERALTGAPLHKWFILWQAQPFHDGLVPLHDAVVLEAGFLHKCDALPFCGDQDVLKHLPGPGALPGLAGMPPGALHGLAGMPPGALPGLGLPPAGLPPLGLPPSAPPPRPPGGALPQPAPQDAAATDTYRWKQDTDEVEVSVSVPLTAVKGEVKVVIQPRCLRLLHRDKALVEGQLCSHCNPEGSTWTLGRGQVTVSLEKKDPRPWPTLFAPVPP
ncbi:unnamed protein product [Prorocentrum cordatum]|uniref:CS domain-containing protein n=1 Tax=Prorocentrum cordatum TaxID=2364126 RepID=A0ABN9UXL4_9DINO|nr:unnamed protein product [Polarella glacialis]